MQELLAAKRDLKLSRVLKRMSKYEVLLIDDIGYVQLELETLPAQGWAAQSPAVDTECRGHVVVENGRLLVNITVPTDLPLFQDFAHKIGVHFDTLHEWKEKHPEFSDAYKRAKQLQESHLVQNGLRGNFVAPFAIFTAKNILGWRDTQHVEQSTTVTYSDLEEQPKARSPEEARRLAEIAENDED